MVPLGEVCFTNGARDTFGQAFLLSSLARHSKGDWGDLDAHDKAENDRNVQFEGRLLSAYERGEETLWIVTEADRSVTTCLLPSEY